MPLAFLSSSHKPLLWKHWKNNSIHQMNRNKSSPYTSRALEFLPRAHLGSAWSLQLPTVQVRCQSSVAHALVGSYGEALEIPRPLMLPERCWHSSGERRRHTGAEDTLG